MIEKKTGPDLALGGLGGEGPGPCSWGRAVQMYYRPRAPTQKIRGLRPKVPMPVVPFFFPGSDGW
jgi:hypothetical protein